MGSLHKIGEDYYIEFYARGLKYQQKIGPGKEAAQKALEDIEAKVRAGEAATIVRDVDCDIFFADFLKNATGKHTPKTRERYQAVVENFIRFLKEEGPAVTKLSQVTPRVIEQYKFFLLKNPSARKRPNPRHINLTLFLLRDILNYAIQSGYLNDNPTIHLRLVKEDRRGIDYSKLPQSARHLKALNLIKRGLPVSRLYKVLGYEDIARVMLYSKALREYWEKDVFEK